jgi:hypothetical protein
MAAALGIFILGVILVAWSFYVFLVFKAEGTQTAAFDDLVLGTGAGSIVGAILLVIGLWRRR